MVEVKIRKELNLNQTELQGSSPPERAEVKKPHPQSSDTPAWIELKAAPIVSQTREVPAARGLLQQQHSNQETGSKILVTRLLLTPRM